MNEILEAIQSLFVTSKLIAFILLAVIVVYSLRAAGCTNWPPRHIPTQTEMTQTMTFDQP